MRVVSQPRWWGLLSLMLVVAGAVSVITWRLGPADALLHSLSDLVPFATAGTIAAPILSGVLGFGLGLLAARSNGWLDQRLRTLVLVGSAICVVWLAVVGTFWFAVQTELMTLLDGAPARAGVSALTTLLFPATVTVFAAAAIIAAPVRSAIRAATIEGHLQTLRSRGLPTSALVIRRACGLTLPTILAVQLIEFLLLYLGSLSVQAVFTTPELAATLPLLLPAESLPLVLAAALLCIIGLITAALAVATNAAGAHSPNPTPAVPEDAEVLLGTGRARSVVLPSTNFRSTDILDIRGLRPGRPADHSPVAPVGGISLTVTRGQTLAVVDDSRDSAVLLAHAIVGLLPSGSTPPTGSILFEGTELLGLPEPAYRRLRGQRIGFLAAPSPSRLAADLPIARQLSMLLAHQAGVSRAEARSGAAAVLERVGIVDSQRVLAAYPHQLSPSTAQRVLLAGALVGQPELLIAHEPTRHLHNVDETDFLDLLHSLQREAGFTLLVVSTCVQTITRCDRVAIVTEGTVVEHASVGEFLAAPRHPHSRRLITGDAAGSAPLGR